MVFDTYMYKLVHWVSNIIAMVYIYAAAEDKRRPKLEDTLQPGETLRLDSCVWLYVAL